jgi:hypothetical protein
MKAGRLKKIPALILILSLMLAPAVPAFAAKPYFKTYGSDVMTGGWFASGNTCSTSTLSPYQDPTKTPGNDFTGGILAFANSIGGSGKPASGASSQYGAFSLGKIDGDTTYHGFYSAGADGSSTKVDYLTFANTDSGRAPWGGLFEGSVRQGNCVPDYYGQMPATATPTSFSLNTLIGLGNDSYKVSASGTNYSLTGGPVTIPAGKHINIYVNGSVYIGSNIFYDGTSTADNVPKLRIVAKGNIYIDPSVTNLDGWYVAQPAGAVVNADDGDIWTCHANDQLSPLDTFILSNCNNQLVINGALTAKHVNLVRLKGDVTTANSSEDAWKGLGLPPGNVAEIINYTPAMVIGGGFLDTSSSSGGGAQPFDSLISLPPVF